MQSYDATIILFVKMSLKMSQNLTNVYNKSKMKIKVSLDITVLYKKLV